MSNIAEQIDEIDNLADEINARTRDYIKLMDTKINQIDLDDNKELEEIITKINDETTDYTSDIEDYSKRILELTRG